MTIASIKHAFFKIFLIFTPSGLLQLNDIFSTALFRNQWILFELELISSRTIYLICLVPLVSA